MTNTTPDLRERLARALYEANPAIEEDDSGPVAWDDINIRAQEIALIMADAVIAALGLPTAAEVDAEIHALIRAVVQHPDHTVLSGNRDPRKPAWTQVAAEDHPQVIAARQRLRDLIVTRDAEGE